jgi:hypothetical protein
MLFQKGADIITSLAEKRLGSKYFPAFGIKVSILSSSMKKGDQSKGILKILIEGFWFYQISASEKEDIRNIALGKPLDKAILEIQKFPGVLRGKISFSGFGDKNFLPKNIQYIRIRITY